MNFVEALSYSCTPTALCGVITGLLCLVLYLGTRRPKGFPPGPQGLPIVGYAPFLGTNFAESLRKMKTKYGPVMSVQMGREHWVILNDYDSINEALVKRGEVFSGRPNNFLMELGGFNGGLALADYGDRWKNLRKFGLMTLRGFGVGKKGMEDCVTEEAPHLVNNLMTKSKDTLRMKLTCAASNIICRVVFGQRFSYDNKRFQTVIRILNKFSEDTAESKVFALLVVAPALRHLPPIKSRLDNMMNEIKVYDDVFKEFVEEHKEMFDENDVRDFIDAFLKEMKHKGSDDPDFRESVLRVFIRDLFEGGTSTTSSSLRWMILAFAHYPQIQEKVAEEVMSTIGESGIPSMKHREEMPYTQAFIQEIIRHRTLLPLSLWHKTNSDCVLAGYRIPKNTTVAPNVWSVHYDPDLFDQPEQFRPERFLDTGGKFVKDPHVIPFSVGPRHCVGEQLARMELFVFLVNIVQKLKIVPNPEWPLPPLHEGSYTSLTYEGPDFEVKFEQR